MKAAEVGNVPAMVLVAEEMERQGRRPKALEWWKKAARKGDQVN
jgi:TPR repeat protein